MAIGCIYIVIYIFKPLAQITKNRKNSINKNSSYKFIKREKELSTAFNTL